MVLREKVAQFSYHIKNILKEIPENPSELVE